MSEQSAADAAQYAEAMLDDTSKAPLFNLSSDAPRRRLVISITQADREAFALESLAAVTLGPLTAWFEGQPLAPAGAAHVGSNTTNTFVRQLWLAGWLSDAAPERCARVLRSVRTGRSIVASSSG